MRSPHPHKTRLPWRPARFLAAVLTAALVALPPAAIAQPLATDLVGTRAVSSAPELRRLAPDISVPAGILVTAEGRVLWARGADDRRAMASTTKMMTALVVRERADLDAVVVVPKAAGAVAQGTVDLTVGESLTVRQLLETMLVASANDAAYTLAVHVGGSEAGFVRLMNEKAAALGLKDTAFRNSHGLDTPGHYSSAADLGVIGRRVMRDPELRRIVALRAVTLSGPGGGRRLFETTHLMLGAYPGIEGVKTGMTDDAGYCLVSSAKRGDVELFGVILGAKSEQSRFSQSRRLLDWGFKHYRSTRVISDETTVGTVPVSDWLDRDIVARVGADRSALLFDADGAVRRRYELQPSVGAPVRKGQVLGTVSALQGDSVLATAAIVAASDMPGPGFWKGMGIFFTRAWRSMAGTEETRTALVTVTE